VNGCLAVDFMGKDEGKRSATPLWMLRLCRAWAGRFHSRRAAIQSASLLRSAGALQKIRVSPIFRTPL